MEKQEKIVQMFNDIAPTYDHLRPSKPRAKHGRGRELAQDRVQNGAVKFQRLKRKYRRRRMRHGRYDGLLAKDGGRV